MSEIVGFVGMSHAPYATMTPPASADAPGGAFMADAARVARAVAELAPDVVVTIGPDHFHGNFYDMMPPFALGVESAEGFGDFDTYAGEVPIAGELAWAIHAELSARDFDIALSYHMTLDHGIVQGWDLICPDKPIPMVPLIVNTAAPPLPSLRRSAALGEALGAALRAWDGPERVLVLASGGLSHWLPSNDPRAVLKMTAAAHQSPPTASSHLQLMRLPALVLQSGPPNYPCRPSYRAQSRRSLARRR